NQWYWGGEAKLRATGDKLQLRSVPAAEWAEVENAAVQFWDEIAAESETKAKVISIFKEYNKVINTAGFPYGQT
ncbi:MAG: C4-dicarboxylate ABC transporter, partial [Nitratireductor sp.]|nr:C4-dicarboxylate ABC transporter [Nitratireductor sp.]